jgi:hypothetical protein
MYKDHKSINLAGIAGDYLVYWPISIGFGAKSARSVLEHAVPVNHAGTEVHAHLVHSSGTNIHLGSPGRRAASLSSMAEIGKTELLG